MAIENKHHLAVLFTCCLKCNLKLNSPDKTLKRIHLEVSINGYLIESRNMEPHLAHSQCIPHVQFNVCINIHSILSTHIDLLSANTIRTNTTQLTHASRNFIHRYSYSHPSLSIPAPVCPCRIIPVGHERLPNSTNSSLDPLSHSYSINVNRIDFIWTNIFMWSAEGNFEFIELL